MKYTSINALAGGQLVGAIATLLMGLLALPVVFVSDTASAPTILMMLTSGIGIIICFIAMFVSLIITLVAIFHLRRQSKYFGYALMVVGLAFAIGIVGAILGEIVAKDTSVDGLLSVFALVMDIASAKCIFSGLAELAASNGLPELRSRMEKAYPVYRNSVLLLIILTIATVIVGALLSEAAGIMNIGLIIITLLMSLLEFFFSYYFYIRLIRLAGRELNAN